MGEGRDEKGRGGEGTGPWGGVYHTNYTYTKVK